jgi:glyoxylase-like metal-dependent hydrolase (beta-lactamase superfamily II)
MPTAEEIFPHIYAIKGAYVNEFLIAEQDGLTLIDSGLKGTEKKIGKAIREIGREPKDLRTILLTHHHADHVGSLAILLEKTEATAYAHPIDIPIIAGEEKRPPPNKKSMLGRVAGPVVARMPANNPPPAKPQAAVEDGGEIPVAGGIKVIHTPGHTMGHISFLMPGHGGVLFVGDAAGYIMGRLGGSPPMFTEDTQAAKDSIRKIAALDFDTACFGHGRVLKGGANAKFRRYVEKMAQ